MAEPPTWHDVPENLLRDWNNIFSPHNKSGIFLDAPCPICGENRLRRFYLHGRPLDRVSDGIRFTSSGSLWEWCGACKAFTHSTALVPDWWRAELDIPAEALTPFPDALEEKISQLGGDFMT